MISRLVNEIRTTKSDFGIILVSSIKQPQFLVLVWYINTRATNTILTERFKMCGWRLNRIINKKIRRVIFTKRKLKEYNF